VINKRPAEPVNRFDRRNPAPSARAAYCLRLRGGHSSYIEWLTLMGLTAGSPRFDWVPARPPASSQPWTSLNVCSNCRVLTT